MKYYIPVYYLSKAKNIIKSLSKKTKVTFEVYENDTHLEVAQLFVTDENTGGVVMRAFNYKVVGIELDVNYKIGDYELVAELEHTENGNIIRKINYNYNVPEMYRSTGCYCEHCKTNRLRKNTFLLADKSGSFKQVGSNCLNDYTGIDSESVINKLSNLSFILREYEIGSDTEFEEFLREPVNRLEPVEEMSNLFYQILLKDGYKKDSANPFYELNNLNYDKSLEPKVKELLNVINTDWYENGNDYCHNVSVVLKNQYVEYKHWRILLSYLWSAMMYLERQKQRELARRGLNNEYLGELGSRIEFEIKSFKLLYTKYSNYTYSGEETYVYRILTTSNNVVIWSTGNILRESEEGKFLCYSTPFTKIKATIKNLEEYRGEKQTVVTRGVVC